MPKVSVIIPTYNREKFVTKAIDSILHQSFRDLEIIVVDDGSTDNTKQVLTSTYAQDIRYVYQKNAGVSAARNVGIRLAKGEWIAFLDSDDEWLPDYLSSQMEHAVQNPDVCTHITNSIQICSSGRRKKSFEDVSPDSPTLILNRPFSFVINCPSQKFFFFLQATVLKRDALIKAGWFNTELAILEDLDMIARMSLEGPMGIYDKSLVYIYRRREITASLSEQLISKRFDSLQYRNVLYKKLALHQKLSTYEKKDLNRVLDSNLRAMANFLLKNGNISKARSCYKDAFLTNRSLKSLVKYLLSFSPKIALLFLIKEYDPAQSMKLGR